MPDVGATRRIDLELVEEEAAATTPLKRLTERQTAILRFMQTYQMEHGYPPTFREIGDAFGISGTNAISDHLKLLERKGYIERAGGARSRGITFRVWLDDKGEPGPVPLPSPRRDAGPVERKLAKARTALVVFARHLENIEKAAAALHAHAAQTRAAIQRSLAELEAHGD